MGTLSLNRQPVQSSNLRSVGYDPMTKTLEIEFHSGGIYQHSNVSEPIHSALISTPSKGKYFGGYIKDRFSTRKIRE